MYDVIIIGKGPAGISAALYTTRAQLNTLVIGKDSPLIRATKIENYYGFIEPVSGEFLLSQGVKQAERLGAVIVEDEVVSIEKDEFFRVSTAFSSYEARAVLLATGQPHKKLDIQSLDSFEGKGVSYCSTCDGFFYRNLKVGVIGYKDYAVHEAVELSTYTGNITIFTNGREPEMTEKHLETASRFKMNTRPIQKIDGTEFLERVYFKDGTHEDIDGVFIAYETASSTDFARKLGVLTEKNSVIVDSSQMTNLDGLFAAGDCTGGFKQISTAVGSGAFAGKSIIEYLRKIK
ncbi:MAG TPA: NAD(P)/FAD-dependent oxidoreductase [Clostridia bacterium]